MRFRPCIDIHNGQVKQIVGGSLIDTGNQAAENFVSDQSASFYAKLYQQVGLSGGHIVLLNPQGSEYYEEDVNEARKALKAYPGGLQIGGGITADNAADFLAYGATHVIVTSYVFRDGRVDYDNLNQLLQVTKNQDGTRLVLDLSCRKKDGKYYIVTDRWQKFTKVVVDIDTLDKLAEYCDEFLIHAVDVEGKARGIETELVSILGGWSKIPVTYAGGVGSFDDLKELKELGQGHLDVTIGSALDLFGGDMEFNQVLSYMESDDE